MTNTIYLWAPDLQGRPAKWGFTWPAREAGNCVRSARAFSQLCNSELLGPQRQSVLYRAVRALLRASPLQSFGGLLGKVPFFLAEFKSDERNLKYSFELVARTEGIYSSLHSSCPASLSTPLPPGSSEQQIQQHASNS